MQNITMKLVVPRAPFDLPKPLIGGMTDRPLEEIGSPNCCS
jgi:hypothetical protein